MSIIQAIILGIIQGATEFIPVSSSGHLVAAPYLFNWNIPESQLFAFDVLVQMGTLLAVIVYFWKDLINIITGAIKGLKQDDRWKVYEVRIAILLILATIPAGFVGLLLKDLVESAFGSLSATTSFLFVTAFLLIIAERIGQRKKNLEKMTWFDALVIGLFQILALFPGVSRSGSTITGSMLRNLDRESSARFSFLMSIPIMLAAGIFTISDLGSVPDMASFFPVLIVGFVTSAIVGFFAIKWFIKFLSNHPLYYFSGYLVLLGIVLLFISS